MRQYFFEGEKDGTPFPRDKRAIVYQRAKMQLDKRPFGTQLEVYDRAFEWMHHSIAAREPCARGVPRRRSADPIARGPTRRRCSTSPR